tara:strand:- start:13258 stop:14085 length:828 start_codon:yes stop_codon:yes gene_type:complete
MKDPNFFIPENVDEFEELAISIAEGDVAMPKDASQELIEKVEEFTSVKNQLSEIDLPSNSIRNAQIQVAVSVATDKVVVPLRRKTLFSSKTSGAIAAAVILFLVIGGALTATWDSSKTSDDLVVAPLSSSSDSSLEEKSSSLSSATDNGDSFPDMASEEPASNIGESAFAEPESASLTADGSVQYAIDLSLYQEEAIELFLLEEFLRSEINELNGNQPCSLEFIQTILGEPIISSAWLPNANISNQILVFFGNQNLVLVNANNCENNFLISGITP